MARFGQFLAIDWSGAAGERHRGIALAVADAAGGPPVLVERGEPWSREEVLAILLELPDDTLVGMDLGLALPFADCGAFFPGHAQSPSDARALWDYIDRVCEEDPHLAAGSFVDHAELTHYFRRHGAREGERFHAPGANHRRGRFRVTEQAQEAMGCKPYSNLNLVGAAQVGKASLTGMRVLNRLRGKLPVWPIDPLPANGSVLVEIYTGLISLEAGRSASRAKMRSYEDLNAALAVLGSPTTHGAGPIDDHSSDALLAAAWLRTAADDPRRWQPAALTPQIARTEGWTFGAL